MRLTSLLVGTTFVLASALSAGAHADLVAADWLSAGDGLITKDAATGLEWLDLSVTDKLAYDTVRARLATDLTGWRVASAGEAEGLFLGLGLPIQDSFGPDPTSAAAIRAAVQFLGDTFADFFTTPADGIVTGFYGFVDMSKERGFHVVKGAFIDVNGVFSSSAHMGAPGDVRLTTANTDGMANDAIRFNHIGTYLVRDTVTVPEPASIALLAAGLIALRFASARNRLSRCLTGTR